MSTSYGKYVEFTCLNDCDQLGCPGHKVRAVHRNTSDTLSFEIDGKVEYSFDYHVFAAMVKSWQENNE